MKLKERFNPEKTFYTSDHHFGHFNVINHCNRPFKTLEEMDITLIKKWNEVVPKDGVVFHLGDLIWSSVRLSRARWILSQLNGRIFWCYGNHDEDDFKLTRDLATNSWIELSADVLSIRVGTDRVFMSHYAHTIWPRSHKGTWHLYGHSHGTLPDDPNSLKMDVGVDTNDFKPYAHKDIARIMSKKQYKPVDNHGK